MSNTSADSAVAELRAANTAAREIKVYAPSVLVAQGVKLTEAQRAVLVRQANALRGVLGETKRQNIIVLVFASYSPETCIGDLRYSL